MKSRWYSVQASRLGLLLELGGLPADEVGSCVVLGHGLLQDPCEFALDLDRNPAFDLAGLAVDGHKYVAAVLVVVPEQLDGYQLIIGIDSLLLLGLCRFLGLIRCHA